MLLAGMAFPSCNVTRKLQPGEYLLQKVVIEEDRTAPRKERIRAEELEEYVRQMPNTHFLWTNFYVWVYNLANPDKDDGWNNFKRKIGEEPVLLDLDLTRKSAENLEIYMKTRGFLSAQVDREVDTTYRRKRAKVVYSIKQNQAYRIKSLRYVFRDKFIEPIICADTANTLLHKGDIFDITVLDRERERITSYLRERGYYDFSVNNISYIADTLTGDHMVDVSMHIKRNIVGYTEKGDAAIEENNAVYRIREINILPDYNPMADNNQPEGERLFDTVNINGLNVVYNRNQRPNVRPKALREALPLYPNYLYDVQNVRRAYDDLMSLGYFKSARISFSELPGTNDSTNYITYVDDVEGRLRMDSLSTNYTKEKYLKCDILCTPALKQSFKVELEASTAASFYGVSATAGYQNMNLFRGIEQFDFSVTAGYEYMKAHADRRNAMEIGFSAGLWFPRFVPFHVSPLSSINRPRTKLEIAFNHQDRPYYRRNLSSLSWTYSWKQNRHSTWTLRPIDINLVNVGYLDEYYANSLQNEYLKNSYRSQLICGLSASYYFDSRLRDKHTGSNFTNIRINAESAGNLIDGLEHIFSHPVADGSHYTIFGIRYSQYFRVDVSASRTLQFGKVTALAGRLFAGFGLPFGNSDTMPFDRLFYSGGSNSMRGWAPRTLGPGSTPEPTGVVYPSQLANMKLEANLEFRFPIWWMFQGATFLDAGNIWYAGVSPDQAPADSEFRFNTFYKQLGFNTGVGLRIDIKFAILRLDWGIQLHNPNKPAGERWIHNFKWANTALNFGVGYSF